MVESGRVPENARIGASTVKLSGRVLKNGNSVIIGKLLNPGEYREKLESARVPKTVWTSTEKWYNECEYRKIVESG